MTCRGCGEQTRWTQKFCKYCGVPMHDKGCKMERDCGCNTKMCAVGAVNDEGKIFGRAFHRLKASTRARIRDPKSYIFRVAWDFQKGRVRRYGRR